MRYKHYIGLELRDLKGLSYSTTFYDITDPNEEPKPLYEVSSSPAGVYKVGLILEDNLIKEAKPI